MGTTKQSFTTSDLGLTSALIASGFELIGMDKLDKRKITFSFVGTLDLKKVSHQYWADKLSISALSYFNAMKMVKSRIYEND